jgi:hypothetical protein
VVAWLLAALAEVMTDVLAVKVGAKEFLWREWVLGEQRFAGAGPRSDPRPDVGYGGPGQRPVPKAWWARFEEFLVNRSDHAEPGGGQPGKGSSTMPAPTGQLSPHFNVREFDCHDGRKVPAVAVPALKRLARDYLEPMRAKFGPAKVLSGYRPADYNARIGGAKFSEHIYDHSPESVAADLVFSRGTPALWAAEADRLGAGGVGRYDRSGFVHVDNRPVRARWSG